MELKNIVATIYLKNGKAVKSPTDLTPDGDIFERVRIYNDCGIDKIFIFDLSDDDEEHEKNLQTIKDLNHELEIKVCAGGNINRFEDIKKIFYTGCLQVMLNGSKPQSIKLAEEASKRFGKDRVLVSVRNVDFIFKNHDAMEENFHEIMQLKTDLSARGIRMVNFTSALKWSDFKLNSDGMVPVIVQDYRTDEVLMLAYMNEEAFQKTISSGKMTYYSRSRQALWMKGETSGHIQYVRSLTADCDFDTILAKVSQIGAACHTGKPSCFFNPILKKEYVEKNPLKVFEEVYAIILDRKANPKEGSYTTYLFDKGIDKILKKLGEENAETIIAAKNPNPEEIKYEISDYLYHLMVLMAEKGITWEDITQELSQR